MSDIQNNAFIKGSLWKLADEERLDGRISMKNHIIGKVIDQTLATHGTIEPLHSVLTSKSKYLALTCWLDKEVYKIKRKEGKRCSFWLTATIKENLAMINDCCMLHSCLEDPNWQTRKRNVPLKHLKQVPNTNLHHLSFHCLQSNYKVCSNSSFLLVDGIISFFSCRPIIQGNYMNPR